MKRSALFALALLLVWMGGMLSGGAIGIRVGSKASCAIAGQAAVTRPDGAQDSTFLIYCNGQEFEARRADPDRVVHGDPTTFTSIEEDR
jgi:hypothetical protein